MNGSRFHSITRFRAGFSSGVPRFTLAAGLSLMLVFLIAAIFAPWIAPFSPTAYSGRSLETPSAVHPLGTNDVGHDILSELVYGARVSILVALVGGGLSLALATLVGLTAGYLGGPVDAVLMRLVDVLMAIPSLPLMILIVAYLGPSLENVILMIALLGWMVPARLMRAQALVLRNQRHVQSAALFGAGPFYILRRHLLPAVALIMASIFVAQAARAIVLESGLAFLGLGDPTVKSWGMMLRHALNYRGLYFTSHWIWWLLPPGICISLLTLGLTFLGIALEAKVDPRLRGRTLGGGLSSKKPGTFSREVGKSKVKTDEQIA